MGEGTLSRRAPHDIHQFRDLAPLVGFVAGPDRMIDAVRHVIAEDLFLDAAQRSTYRADLRHDVDAITIFFNHARQAPHLPLYAVEPADGRDLAVLCHARYIPPRGI